MNKTLGMKKDAAKLRYDLVTPGFLEGLVQVLTFGAEKYAPDNWKHVEPSSRYYEALMRHLEAVRKGEWLDPESGQPHMDHVACNVMFLRERGYNRKTPLTVEKLDKFLDGIKKKKNGK